MLKSLWFNKVRHYNTQRIASPILFSCPCNAKTVLCRSREMTMLLGWSRSTAPRHTHVRSHLSTFTSTSENQNNKIDFSG